MRKEGFNTMDYWENRIINRQDLRGTGHRSFSVEYNQLLYDVQDTCMDSLVQEFDVQIKYKTVLDIGSGIGFFVDYFLRNGASSVVGLDITNASIEYLSKTFPSEIFFQADISAPDLPIEGPFDIVSAMGILYHIVDDDKFEQALTNLCEIVAKGGYLFISDSFKTPLIPSARHAHFRSLEIYESTFRRFGIKVINLIPCYYFLNQTFIPIVGPKVIEALRIDRLFFFLDRMLRNKNFPNGGGIKILLATKNQSLSL